MAVRPSMLLTECPQVPLEDPNISLQFSKGMKPLSLSTFLGENGVPFDVCEIFEGIYIYNIYIYIIIYIYNYIYIYIYI